MSNRQARREQSRTARQTPRQRSSRASSPGPRKSSNLPDWMSPGFLIVAGAVVVLGLAALIFLVVSGESSDDAAAAKLEEAIAEIPHDLANGQVLGHEEAPLTVTMYEDFQCHFCLRFTAEDEPMLVEEYVKTGKIKLEYKLLPILGTESVRAATASVCAAEQDRFWEYQYRVYLLGAEQGQLSSPRNDSGRLSDDKLRRIAQDMGLDMAAYDSCFADPATQDTVAEQHREATELGIRSTPTFLFNGRPLQGTPVDHDAWREILDQQIAEAQASGDDANETAEASPTDEGEAEETATSGQ